MAQIKYLIYTATTTGAKTLLLSKEGVSLFYAYNEEKRRFVDFDIEEDLSNPEIYKPVSKGEAFQFGYNDYTDKKGKTFIQKAWFVAAFFHYGQKWKDGKDVMEHLECVASTFVDMAEQIVAILHELLTLTDCNAGLLKVVFGERITEAVEALTRKRGEDIVYTYIPRVRRNVLARHVKIVDIRELMDLNKLPQITEVDIETYHKYKQIGLMLGAAFIEIVPQSILLEENRYDSMGRILPKRRSKNYSKLTDCEKLLLPENPYEKGKNSAYFEFEGKDGYWVTDSAKKELHETIEMKPIKLK